MNRGNGKRAANGPCLLRIGTSALFSALAVLLLLCATALPARADGGHGPPPQAPPADPPDDSDDGDDPPRRDFRMGARDNMSMGRDKEGNLVMEVSPRPRKNDAAQQTPLYIYPQVYTGGTPYSGQGTSSGQNAATGQSVTSGQSTGQSTGQGVGQTGQAPAQLPAMVYSPNGGPHGVAPGGPGGMGGPGGQPPPMVHSPQGAGPSGAIPAPPGPSRGAPTGQ